MYLFIDEQSLLDHIDWLTQKVTACKDMETALQYCAILGAACRILRTAKAIPRKSHVVRKLQKLRKTPGYQRCTLLEEPGDLLAHTIEFLGLP